MAHVVPGSTRALDEFRWQQEVILHELRHALLGTHPAGGTSDDYNRGIREHCFGADEFSQ